ncbi:MAG: hypothetical protein IE884_07855 [Sulfuricurvum sp.]|nr:hypothetical protein [Sulfuricurvum sp.]
MKYIITALDAEARVFCEHYSLKRSYVLPYTLYTDDETLLLVCGMGKMNALMATSALLGYRIPKEEDILVNIGICGAPKNYPIGEALLIHQIIEGDRHHYPDILYTHPLRESPLICVDAPRSSPSEFPVDMESGGVFSAASKFFKLHQMGFVKIVSDHFEPHRVTKEGVIELLDSHTSTLEEIIRSLQDSAVTTNLFSPDERREIETFKTLFTKSQGSALEDALCFFRLKNGSNIITLPTLIPNSKRERSALLEEYIAALIS